MTRRVLHDIPHGTYRLQLSSAFTFAHAKAHLDGIAQLGIDWLYLSPIQMTPPDATHGYAIIDPTRIDPQLEAGCSFRTFVEAAHERGLKILLDIVPNHLASGTLNPYWYDIMKHGRQSAYASWFDIEWSVNPKIVWPILPTGLVDTVADGGVRIADNHIVVGNHYLPISIATPVELIRRCQVITDRLNREDAEGPLTVKRDLVQGSSDSTIERGSAQQTIQQTAQQDSAQQTIQTDASADQTLQNATEQERSLEQTTQRDSAEQTAQDETLDQSTLTGNVDRVNQEEQQTILELLSLQHYELRFWQVGLQQLNWRRFFTIPELAGLRVEDPAVFQATHSLIFNLCRQGLVDGLRIDHIDGLVDPKGYLDNVVRTLPSTYIVVEKILGQDETLPSDWQMEGETGYQQGMLITALLAGDSHFAADQLFYALCPYDGPEDVQQRLYEAKVTALSAFNSEISRITRLLAVEFPNTAPSDLRHCVIALAAGMAVYRTYIQPINPRSPKPVGDEPLINQTLEFARKWYVNCLLQHLGKQPGAVHAQDSEQEAISDSLHALLAKVHGWVVSLRGREALLLFQQLSGPAMAKGFEDLLLYQLVSQPALCEVGTTPAILGGNIAAEQLVQRIAEARSTGLIALSTHDSKRSEDIRARMMAIIALGLTDPEFKSALIAATQQAPEPTIGYLSLMTMTAMYGLVTTEPVELAARCERAMWKSAREAQLCTSWYNPNLAAEAKLADLITALTPVVNKPSITAEIHPNGNQETSVEQARDNATTPTNEHRNTGTSKPDEQVSIGTTPMSEQVNAGTAPTNKQARDTRLLSDSSEENTELAQAVVNMAKKITPLAERLILSQVALRGFVPGVPDIYEGCEIITDKLVDPDNRQLVDYKKITKAHTQWALYPDLYANGSSNAKKIGWITTLQRIRKEEVGQAVVQPLPILGEGAEYAWSFLRSTPSQSWILFGWNALAPTDLDLSTTFINLAEQPNWKGYRLVQTTPRLRNDIINAMIPVEKLPTLVLLELVC